MKKELTLKDAYIMYCEQKRNEIILKDALCGKNTKENKEIVKYLNNLIDDAKNNNKIDEEFLHTMMMDLAASNFGVYGEER